MKTNKFTRSLLLVCAVLALVAGSCKKSGRADLYRYATAEDIVVANVSLNNILENAGCTVTADGIQFSDAINRLLERGAGADRDLLNFLATVKGADTEHMVVAMAEDYSVRVAVALTDRKAFCQWVESANDEFELTKQGDYEYYYLDMDQILVVTDNEAVYCFSADLPDDQMADFEEFMATDHTPLPGWAKDEMDDGNSLNLCMNIAKFKPIMEDALDARGEGMFNGLNFITADTAAIYNGFCIMNIDLEGNELDGTSRLFGADGRQITGANKCFLDSEVLRFVGHRDLAMVAAAIPGDIDWHEVLNRIYSETGQNPNAFGGYVNTQIEKVLGSLDGTAMIAAGPKNFTKVKNVAGWDGVIVATMKKGEAAQYVSQLYGLAQMFGFNPVGSVNDFSVTFPATGHQDAFTVYVKNDSELFVASLSPITTTDPCPLYNTDVDGKVSVIAFNLPKSNVITTLLSIDFGINVEVSVDNEGVEFEAELEECPGTFLANIFEYLAR